MKKVLINVEERELRVAILEDEQLVELYIESLDEKSILNNIYKGRVEDVLPGLKAAFVNVGLDRNAFLHFDDVRPDLLWGKYRELNPDMADEVPTAREALAAPVETEAEGESEQEDGKRKRRRGRRGGKKRRPDAEDTYSPGLPVGVTEDDLEDDEEEETENVVHVHRSEAPPAPAEQEQFVAAPAQASYPAAASQPSEQQAQQAPQGAAPAHGDISAEEVEARKLARMEKQKQRRERWEQKKLERQQRRQQERAERAERGGNVAPEAYVAPDRQPTPPRAMEIPQAEPVPPPVYGTRAAAAAYDASAYAVPNRRQLQQNKARYGDAFGNIAVGVTRRNDHRDSQVDFFGPATPTHEEEHSIWDERQPNLGPVPGAGKAFLADFETRGNERRSGGDRRPSGGQQQNRNNKKFTSTNKRRGGKKRSMRKRDNRSYFSFSADDIIEDDKPLNTDSVAEETEAPKKKTTRTRKTAAAAEGEDAPKKKAPAKKATTVRKTAATKTTATKAAAKKKPAEAKGPEAVAQELPLGISESADTAAVEEKAAPKKTTRARKTTTTRTRKTTAKATDAADELKLDTAEEKPATAEKPAAPEDNAPAEVAKPVAEAKPVEAAPVEAPAPAAKQEEAKPDVPSEPVSRAPETAQPEASAAPADAAQDTAEPVEATATAPEGSASGEQQPGDQQSPQRRRSSRPTRAERAARHRARRAEARAAEENGGADPAAQGTETASDQSAAVADAAPAPADTAEAKPAATVPATTERPQRQQQPQQQARREQRHKLRRPQFQEVFKKGDEIMVQVVKEEIGMKGARISSYVSLPGRYLVLLPYPNQEGGISRKVEDIRERKRLKTLLKDISSDETAFIVRTAGVYQEEKEIRDDVEFLSHEWATIADRYAKADATALVYDDHDILYRLARDVFDDSVAEIHIDSHLEHEKLKAILGKLIPDLVDKVKLYSGAENIFHKFGVTKQIQKAARRKVWLKSGGYLIIDEAEALTAVDVNTGKSVGKDDQEKLILRTNLEAARATARELKLRDIGGLIVIDFIDMKDARNKEQVLSELKLQLRKDRSKTSVSAISEFGLVEMTRKRVRRSLRKTLFMDCPYCQGAGVVLNEQQIWLHIKHEVVRQLESTKPAPTLSITVNPRIRAYIDQNYRDVMRRLEQKYDTEIRVTMSDIFHIENYQIEAAETSGVISGSATMPTR